MLEVAVQAALQPLQSIQALLLLAVPVEQVERVALYMPAALRGSLMVEKLKIHTHQALLSLSEHQEKTEQLPERLVTVRPADQAMLAP